MQRRQTVTGPLNHWLHILSTTAYPPSRLHHAHCTAVHISSRLHAPCTLCIATLDYFLVIHSPLTQLKPPTAYPGNLFSSWLTPVLLLLGWWVTFHSPTFPGFTTPQWWFTFPLLTTWIFILFSIFVIFLAVLTVEWLNHLRHNTRWWRAAISDQGILLKTGVKSETICCNY